MEIINAILERENSFSGLINIAKHYYTEPHRCYHDWRHIQDGASKIITLSENDVEEFKLSTAQQLAWLFHDIVYVPYREKGDNENDSAHLMRHILNQPSLNRNVPTVNEEDIVEASTIIIDTIHHYPSLDSSCAVLDIDLSGFYNSVQFLENNDRIGIEFGIEDDEKLREGQKKFLNEFINSRECIYHTEYAKKYWESAAMKTIRDYIG